MTTLRADALERFGSMPIPSQETEEWRYTDLSDFDLDFVPFSPGGGPEALNRHGLLEAAAVAGERAGLQIQRNSEVISTQRSGASEAGVIFCDLDVAAATHPDLVERYLHSLVPRRGRSSWRSMGPSARAAPSSMSPTVWRSTSRSRRSHIWTQTARPSSPTR